MLDVHVALSPDTPPLWAAQCARSVEIAAAHAGYPVAVHFIAGEPGHIGLARQRGYAQGTYPFCTFVDDDDFVSEDAFVVLEPHLAEATRLLFTRERLEQNGKFGGYGIGHHLAVVRREDAMAHDWENYPAGGEGALYAKLGEPIQLDNAVYTHRLYRSKGRALRVQYPG